MSLAQLPTELYFNIIQQFDPDDAKSSLLALSRAIPHSPVPVHALFKDIVLKTPRQVISLNHRLRKHPADVVHVVTFALESLVVDADVLVNLLAMLPNIRELTLFIGPCFAPEHLEDLFTKPRPLLKYLSLRFRPYVLRATYLQFMKGAYFDSMLLFLSRWPRAELPVISIIQDPIDKTIAPSQNFAQPLVFFHFEPLSTFASSPLAETVSHVRIRVPGRQVAQYIAKNPRSFGNIELLDMATCDVGPNQVQDIICRLRTIRYLILDGCPVVSQRIDALDAAGAEDYSNWAALGQTFATMGLRVAREREGQLRHWLESIAIAEQMENLQVAANPSPPSTSKKRAGRHKVAMSPFKMRTSSLNKSSGALPSQSPAGGSSLQQSGKKIARVRVLPPVPTLQSLALTAPMITSGGPDLEERCDAARSAFELGWAEGLAVVAKKRALMKTSWTNKIRVMSMVKLGSKSDNEAGEDGEGFAGLEDIHASEEFNILDERCPTLCLAGPGREGRHLDRCPHTLGWEAFKDEL